MLLSPIKNPIKPVLRSPIKGLSLAISRYFHRLKPAASQYYTLGEVSIPSEWKSKITFSSGDESNQVLWGDSHTTNLYVNYSSTGLTVWISGQYHSYSFGSMNPHDGALHELSISTVGGVVKAYLDSIELVKTNSRSLTPFVGVAQLKVGTSNSAAIRYDGYISDFEMLDSLGDVIVKYSFDSSLESPYQFSDDVVLGENVVGNGAFSSDLSDWVVVNSGGNIAEWTDRGVHVVSDGTAVGVRQEALTPGRDYLVKFTVDVVSGNGKVQAGSESLSFNESGTYFRIFKNVANQNLFVYRNVACNFYCSNIEATEIPVDSSFSTAINMDVSDAQLFDLVDGRWLGPDTLIGGSFDSGSGWVFGSHVYYDSDNGQIVYDNAGGDPNDRAFYRIQSRHKKYQVSLDADISSGTIRFYDGSDYSYPITFLDSKVFEITNVNNDYSYFIVRADSGFSGIIRSIQLRPIIEVPL